jgi:hypothetical protein
LYEISNDNGDGLVNFATSTTLRVKRTTIQVERRRQSNIHDVRLYRAAECDSDHYLVVAKVRERLAVNKQGSHKFHIESFNLKKLNDAVLRNI